MRVTSAARLLSRGGDGVGRYQARVASGYGECLCLELNGPDSQRGDTCRFALKRIIISLTVKLFLSRQTYVDIVETQRRPVLTRWWCFFLSKAQSRGSAADRFAV